MRGSRLHNNLLLLLLLSRVRALIVLQQVCIWVFFSLMWLDYCIDEIVSRLRTVTTVKRVPASTRSYSSTASYVVLFNIIMYYFSYLMLFCVEMLEPILQQIRQTQPEMFRVRFM
jgi:hypothetical protein